VAVSGGSPFADPRLQGYLTGLALQPNGYEQGDLAAQEAHLDHLRVMITLGLAGNLRDYTVTDSHGNPVSGGDYGRVAYAASPEETVNYVSAHDNETLFDTIMLKVSPGNELENDANRHD
jgi:pullulanase